MKPKPLPLILVFAFVLRLFVFVRSGGFFHSDEIFQSLEVAFFGAQGFGIIPFEFVYGMRSFFYPLLIQAIFTFTSFVSASFALFSTHFTHVLASMLIVCFTYLLVRSHASQREALSATFFVGVWWELLVYSSRTLSTPVMLIPLLGALGLSVRGPKSRFFAGILLGIAGMIRPPAFILAPVILLYVWRSKQDIRSFVFGLFLSLLFSGVLDWVIYGFPFVSTFRFFYYNILSNQSAQFGVAPFVFYVQKIALSWRFMLIPLLGVLVFTWEKQHRLVLASAFVWLVVFSFIPHKEYRFILPLTVLLLIMFGTGLSMLVKKNTHLVWCFAGFTLVSVLLLFSTNLAPKETFCQAQTFVGNQAAATGLILFDTWSETCGYVYTQKNIPLLFFPSLGDSIPRVREAKSPRELELAFLNATFNYAILSGEKSEPVINYENRTGFNTTRIAQDLLLKYGFKQVMQFGPARVFAR
ncbi:hypothetical protein COT72_00400 [archaeon CG10_big_fil_rev_8_21_14_0_10_43_11]|nr:MAG: hypothetical protein COT72_00400 [archaeon CG10_big_fil_rev_8_21_14_0_10_43_11]